MADTASKTGQQTVLVMGPNTWGRGETLAEAKKAYKDFGGNDLRDGYVVVTFDEETEFLGVDTMFGNYSYRGNEPTVEVVKGRLTK